MGKILKNGIEYTPNANTLSVPLTRAQYDALSEADKMKDIYYYVEDEEPFTTNNAVYGYTPIGTVISVMGNHAPKNYLACNGQVVNIVDYPELAQYFEEEFGAINKFGGDGATTFGIPDLRGEFLRGTGTNSHTGEGNGANVGTHQGATDVPFVNSTTNALLVYRVNNSSNIEPLNYDGSGPTSDTYRTLSGSGSSTTGYASRYKVRPTNTSVLYCIAYKNIYITPENLYSTDEKVVGEWIDGKPLYQKTISGTAGTASGSGSSSKIVINNDISSLNIDTLVNASGCIKWFESNSSKGWVDMKSSNYSDGNPQYFFTFSLNNNSSLNIYVTGASTILFNSQQYSVTLQYTKTTD